MLTGTFQLSCLGIPHGGPAYWWSWPTVFAGRSMAARSLDAPELSSIGLQLVLTNALGPLIGRFFLLLVTIGQPQSFSAITSLAIVLIYLAYLLVTTPMLVARFRGRWSSEQEGRFPLGRFGLPVNILAVLWGGGMVTNPARPRRTTPSTTPHRPTTGTRRGAPCCS